MNDGVCKIFQTDNGPDFNNQHLKINGCFEAAHKEIKNFIINYYEKYKTSFEIEIGIQEPVESHIDSGAFFESLNC